MSWLGALAFVLLVAVLFGWRVWADFARSVRDEAGALSRQLYAIDGGAQGAEDGLPELGILGLERA